ncbi:hypothetical protein SKAU_G00346670 [Synaphobranchus kaupii]|uniref:Uncharacterized protein n=1 Tax=Synaphobranchus kaupii TaxID=118154 RepID=A0A9Q1IHT4_SYNKA|nr:hypothetical protein SKAU_G00346670 [Synaphobranchus kaupii]
MGIAWTDPCPNAAPISARVCWANCRRSCTNCKLTRAPTSARARPARSGASERPIAMQATGNRLTPSKAVYSHLPHRSVFLLEKSSMHVELACLIDFRENRDCIPLLFSFLFFLPYPPPPRILLFSAENDRLIISDNPNYYFAHLFEHQKRRFICIYRFFFRCMVRTLL